MKICPTCSIIICKIKTLHFASDLRSFKMLVKCRLYYFFLISSNFFLLLCWVGVHCSICKSSYNLSNISYLNYPLHCSFSSSLPQVPEQSQQVLFLLKYFLYLHVYILFASPLFPSPTSATPAFLVKKILN
jgi:hypothetical protein